MNTIVKTGCGTVEGVRDAGLVKWLGIPYAKEPVGELRFRRAVACEPWEGKKLCQEYGNSPVNFLSVFPSIGNESEDCLNLNVWRPDNDEKKLPVFVWIYGGAYASGEACDVLYNGARFAREGVVYISINYRVGPLGAFDFSAYDKESFDSNCWLSDQIMALKWIKANAEVFGGDSDNITIAGESAGGTSICALLASPAAKGLFNKAIVQSGMAKSVLSERNNKLLLDMLIEQLGLTADTVGKLREMDTADMKKAVENVLASSNSAYPGTCNPGPVFDDLIPGLISKSIRSGAAKDVKLIIGTMRDENTEFYAMGWVPASWEQIEKMLSMSGHADKLEAFKKTYGGAGSEKDQFVALSTDSQFLIGSAQVADAQSEYNDVWMYRFDYAPIALRESGVGAAHGYELPICLGNLEGPYGDAWIGTPENVINKLTAEMAGTWLSFAKNGDPNHGKLDTRWEKYDSTHRKTYVFDEQSHVMEAKLSERLALWDGLELYP